jgi:hypothetical protein
MGVARENAAFAFRTVANGYFECVWAPKVPSRFSYRVPSEIGRLLTKSCSQLQPGTSSGRRNPSSIGRSCPVVSVNVASTRIAGPALVNRAFKVKPPALAVWVRPPESLETLPPNATGTRPPKTSLIRTSSSHAVPYPLVISALK